MTSVDDGKSGSRSLPQTVLLSLLRGYKRVLSPMFLPSCRYVPTCSDYAAEAVEKHGAVRGSALAIWRLLRCHPFVRGGFDPVPSVLDGQGFFRTRASGAIQVEPGQAGSVCSHTTH
jgi:uncharacterized protein